MEVTGSPGGRGGRQGSSGSTLLRPMVSIFVPLQARTELPQAQGSIVIWDSDAVPEPAARLFQRVHADRGEEKVYMHTCTSTRTRALGGGGRGLCNSVWAAKVGGSLLDRAPRPYDKTGH